MQDDMIDRLTGSQDYRITDGVAFGVCSPHILLIFPSYSPHILIIFMTLTSRLR